MIENKPPEIKDSDEKECPIEIEDDIDNTQNIEDGTKKTILELIVTGMHCTACAQNIEKILKKENGIVDARVSFATGTAAVT